MRVGLTGGIGSGKSEVAKYFSQLGAFVIDTDELAREAVAPDSDGLREIAHQWPEVVREGMLDRPALAEIIFADPVERARLNAIVHPHVRRLAEERERFAKPGQLIVQVIPLLFEVGLDERMDKTVVVIAPDANRIARVTARDNSSEEQVRSRMDAQISPDDARARADYVIENDGDLDYLRRQVENIYTQLMTTAA